LDADHAVRGRADELHGCALPFGESGRVEAAVERIVMKRRGEGAVGLLENGTQMARDDARQDRNEKGPEARKLRGP